MQKQQYARLDMDESSHGDIVEVVLNDHIHIHNNSNNNSNNNNNGSNKKRELRVSTGTDEETLSSSGPSLLSSLSLSSSMAPLSRPPSNWRDFTYLLLFVTHYAVVASISLLDSKANRGHTFIPINEVGGWTSSILTVTFLGSIGGTSTIILCTFSEFRESILSLGTLLSLVVRILLTAYFIWLKTDMSIVIGVIFAVGVIVRFMRYKKSTENLNFTSALVDLTIEICDRYGRSLLLFLGLLLALQTCVMMAWGTYLLHLLADLGEKLVEVFAIFVIISLYWTMQFFSAIVAYVIGGCVSWYFAVDENTNDPTVEYQSHLRLYIASALTTGFGTICKGSLLSPIADGILRLHAWARPRNAFVVLGRFSLRQAASRITSPVVAFAKSHSRLAFPLAACYGTTLCSSVEYHLARHPQAIDLLEEDCSSPTVMYLAELVGGVLALISAAVIAGGKSTNTAAALFVVLVYIFSYAGVSLCLQVFLASFRAILIAFSTHPARLAKENQIIFLRYYRSAETALRA